MTVLGGGCCSFTSTLFSLCSRIGKSSSLLFSPYTTTTTAATPPPPPPFEVS
ncbi:hypothetical protein NC653_007746 [Populus alba x Populus x berolinensis]|uniref:Uncharacterized protein n=1 Tax=Populus alba x Populus x berolinensis TaxID=444605 RepID=A0AAD6RJ81_9ROSI|nr:hypothetical protein NC653_007746 [Populus alba x Populus x berolinensis]